MYAWFKLACFCLTRFKHSCLRCAWRRAIQRPSPGCKVSSVKPAGPERGHFTLVLIRLALFAGMGFTAAAQVRSVALTPVEPAAQVGAAFPAQRGGLRGDSKQPEPSALAGVSIAPAFPGAAPGRISAHAYTSPSRCPPWPLTRRLAPAGAATLASGTALMLLVLALGRRRRTAGRTRRRSGARLCALPCALLLATGAAAAGPPLPYYVTPLRAPQGAELSVAHLNDLGQIAATLGPADGDAHAYLITGTRWTDLGTLGGRNSGARDVNNLGHVVGYAQSPVSGSARAFLYRDGAMQDLGTLGAGFAFATALNDAGQVIGISRTAEGADRAFFYSNGTMTPIGSLAAGREDSSAVDINASGQVTGAWSDNFGWTRTYIWQDGQMRDVGTLGGHWSEPTAINDAGDIAGRSETRVGAFMGFAWMGGRMREIGALPGDSGSGANDINNAGDVIGASWGRDEYSHPFLWRDGSLYDLNRYLMPGAELRIDGVSDINDRGQILASGCAGWSCGPVLLTPVPEPATAVMLVLGLLTLAIHRRRC